MVGGNLAYVQRVLAGASMKGPVLELGTGYGGSTCRDFVLGTGARHVGTDMTAGPGVNVVANFERSEDMNALRALGPFAHILVLNVLEHCFEPIRVLDNARTLLTPGGRFVIVTPAVWPLHSYPMDVARLLPNFYEEYAKRRGLRLVSESFEYINRGRVDSFRDEKGEYRFPPPAPSRWRHNVGRVIHRAFDTFGRGMMHSSWLAIGATVETPLASLSHSG